MLQLALCVRLCVGRRERQRNTTQKMEEASSTTQQWRGEKQRHPKDGKNGSTTQKECNAEKYVHDRCWSRANSSANATLAISTTVCRAGAAKSEVSLYTNISRSAGKPTDKFMMPVLCFNVISGERHADNFLVCSEFLILPTEAGSVAKNMIIDTEVHHLLQFGRQKDVQRDVCNVGDETAFL